MYFRCSALMFLSIVAFAAVSEDLPLMGNSLGGSAFRRSCPDNHVLTGIRYRRGLVLDGIGIQCRPVRADGTLGDQINFGSMAGGSGGTLGTVSCSANHVIASQQTTLGGSAVGCHQWVSASRTWHSERSNAMKVAGPIPSGPLIPCSKNIEPGHGIHGRHGMIVDRWGVSCDSP
jgi:hypothetical protein